MARQTRVGWIWVRDYTIRKIAKFGNSKVFHSKQDLPGSRSLIGILLRHLRLEGSGEIAARMRASVFKEYDRYLSLRVNTEGGTSNLGGHLIPQA